MSAQDARGPKDHDAPRSGAPPSERASAFFPSAFSFVAEENLSSRIDAIAGKSRAMIMSGTEVQHFQRLTMGIGTRFEGNGSWAFRAAIALNRSCDPMPLSCARSHEQERK